jgi:hypothetical protein
MLSEIGWEKFQITPGNFSSCSVHRGDQLLLVLMKDGPPIFLALQVDKVLRVEKARRIGSIIRTTCLANDLGNFRKGSHHSRRALVREVDARGGAFTWWERTADPNGTLVEVGQKLRTNGTADR